MLHCLSSGLGRGYKGVRSPRNILNLHPSSSILILVQKNLSSIFTNMRCSPIYMNLLVTSVLASPALVAVPDSAHNEAMSARNIAETDLIAETIIFGVESAKCKILKCAKIIATGACIIGALPDIDSTLACVSGNSEAVSSPFFALYRAEPL